MRCAGCLCVTKQVYFPYPLRYYVAFKFLCLFGPAPTRGFYGCPSHCCTETLLTTFTYILSYLDLPSYTKRNCSIVVPAIGPTFGGQHYVAILAGMDHGPLHCGLVAGTSFTEPTLLLLLGGLVPLFSVGGGLPFGAEERLSAGFHIIIFARSDARLSALWLSSFGYDETRSW